MAKYSKKNRAIVSGIFVGLASIYAIASHFDVDIGVLNEFMVATVGLFLLIVVLAAVTVVLFKGVSRLLRGKDDDAGPGSKG
jgi:hypothetical protein